MTLKPKTVARKRGERMHLPTETGALQPHSWCAVCKEWVLAGSIREHGQQQHNQSKRPQEETGQ